MAKDTTKITDFSFDADGADWSFGASHEDTTGTSTAVKAAKAKVGATIDDADDDDDTEGTANLDEGKGVVDDKDDKGDVGDTIKKPKVEPKKEPAPIKKEKTAKKEDADDEDEDDKDVDDEENDEDESKDTEFFKDASKKDKEKPKAEKAEVEDEQEDGKFYSTLTAELKEKGIFEHVELPKDKEDLTEDEFLEIFEDEFEARLNESFEAFTEKMDDEGKDFIKHKRKGGSTREFVEAYYGSGIDYENFDVEDDSQRDDLLRYYLTTVEGLKGDDLDDRIEALKDKGKDKTKATEWVSKLKTLDEKKKEDFKAKQKTLEEEKKEKSKKYNEALMATLDKVDEVNKYPITKEDKKKLGAFFTKQTVKAGKDNYVAPFHAKLAGLLNPKNKEDREKLVLLGALLENDFDFSKITPKLQTQVTRRAQRTLQQARNGVKVNSAKIGSKSLANYFEDEDSD
jgi:hypothetical protein